MMKSLKATFTFLGTIIGFMGLVVGIIAVIISLTMGAFVQAIICAAIVVLCTWFMFFCMFKDT